MPDRLTNQQARDLSYRIAREASWWTAWPLDCGFRSGWRVSVKYRQTIYSVRSWEEWEQLRDSAREDH